MTRFERLTVLSLGAFCLLFVFYFGALFDTARATDVATGNRAFGNFLTKSPYANLRDTARIVMVGDILLARDVEKQIETHGYAYPFKKIKEELRAGVVVGNFEAPIPEIHTQTEPYTTTFSVKSDYTQILREAGFTHVSLANNHAFDHGEEGLLHTQKVFKAASTTPLGHPERVSSTSVSYLDIGGTPVSLIAMHAVGAYPREEEWLSAVEKASYGSAFQIVFIHWGEEYKNQHNKQQEAFAHALIDAGVDLIVGHHPHVVQDIGVYEGVPIIYSLGNFVFDQYFSTEVQEGLLISVAFGASGGSVKLIPVSSIESKAQPYIMDIQNTKAFLKQLAERSDTVIQDDILAGELSF